jgi:hypothetical protein
MKTKVKKHILEISRISSSTFELKTIGNTIKYGAKTNTENCFAMQMTSIVHVLKKRPLRDTAFSMSRTSLSHHVRACVSYLPNELVQVPRRFF